MVYSREDAADTLKAFSEGNTGPRSVCSKVLDSGNSRRSVVYPLAMKLNVKDGQRNVAEHGISRGNN